MSEILISEKYKKNYKHYYESGDYEWRRIGAVGKADNILKFCNNMSHDCILEIGAGEGSILNRLSQLGFGKELYALEISPSGVETINNKQILRLIEAVVFDGYKIPYCDNKFDIAILSHVIEHVEHPRLLLYEASRVAKLVFVEVPLEDTIRLSSNFKFNKVGHINFYSQKSIRMLLQSCNLKVLKEMVINPPKEAYTFQKGYKGLINYHIKKLVIKFAPWFATRIFTFHGVFICEKCDKYES